MSAQTITVSSTTLLKDFSDNACTVESVSIPQNQTFITEQIFNTDDKASINVRKTHQIDIVEFDIVYTPLHNSAGINLLKQAKMIVANVLTKSFKQASTLIIFHDSTGKETKRYEIQDSYIKSSKLLFDIHDYVKIEIKMVGILGTITGE